MAKSINQVILMGRLTRDPELRTTASGKAVTSFSLAVDRQGSEETDFFDITAWEKLAQLVVDYLEKGRRVVVQGRLQLDRWEKDGQKSSKVTITANDITFLDSAGSDESLKDSRPAKQHEVLEQAGELGKDVAPEDIDGEVDLSSIPF